MNTRKPYNQPGIRLIYAEPECLMGVNSRGNVRITPIGEGDAATAQSKTHWGYDDYHDEEEDDDSVLF